MIRKFIRAVGLKIAQTIGAPIRDFRSGKPLGRALIFAWRGKIHVIGLDTAVRPMFQPQKRLTYWKQEIVFTEHPPPDFARERKAGETGISKSQAPKPTSVAGIPKSQQR